MTAVETDQERETLRLLDFDVTVLCSWVHYLSGEPCTARASYLACCVNPGCPASSAVCEEHRVLLTLQQTLTRCLRCGLHGRARDIVRWVSL